jgi:phospholipid/cholesterol/gamma-HCH transport system permease protein
MKRCRPVPDLRAGIEYEQARRGREVAAELMGFTVEYDATAACLCLGGDCRMADAPTLERELRALRNAGPSKLTVDFASAGEFDIGPAWLLQRALAECQAAGSRIESVGPTPEHAHFLQELTERDVGSMPPPEGEERPAWLVGFGKGIVERVSSWYEALTFGGELTVTAAAAWTSVKRLRIPSIVRHVYETGLQAIPVVAVIAFLISVISAYIGAQQLQPFGAEIFTVDLVAIGVLRELGVLLTAIMVAGRTGSAFAAELGVMKLNDEVDALESMGMNPYEVLVLPRVLGLVISLPLLTVVADMMGLAGGAMLTTYLLELPFSQFVMRLESAVGETTFWAGMVKAPVFGLLIALTGTLRGLQVRESSRELGRLTTVAVVQSIFLVIFADALFAIFFLEIDF